MFARLCGVTIDYLPDLQDDIYIYIMDRLFIVDNYVDNYVDNVPEHITN